MTKQKIKFFPARKKNTNAASTIKNHTGSATPKFLIELAHWRQVVLITIFIFVLTTKNCYSQKNVMEFYDADWKREDSAKAMYYRIISYDKNGIPIGKVKDYYISGNLQFKGKMTSVDPDKMKGKCIWYYETGKMHKIEHYNKNGDEEGKSVEYFENGTKAFQSKWKFFSENDVRGNFTSYYSDGTKESEGDLFKKGIYGKVEQVGKHKYWRQNGSLHFIDWYDKDGSSVPLSHYCTQNGEFFLLHNNMSIASAIYNLKSWFDADLLEIPDDSLVFYFNDELYKLDFELIPLKEGKNSICCLKDSSYKVFTIKNKKIHGLYTEYNKDGTKKVEGIYHYNKKHGTWKYWWTGHLDYEANYRKGILHGQERRWRDTILEIRNNYKNGKLHGELELFYFWDGPTYSSCVWYTKQIYRRGKLKNSRYYYVDSVTMKPTFPITNSDNDNMGTPYFRTAANKKFTGKFIYYYDNGKVWAEQNYTRGKPVGIGVVYHRNGNKASEGEFTDGLFYSFKNLHSLWDTIGNQLIKNGNGTYTDESGQIITYKNGFIVKTISYHPNGQIRTVETSDYSQDGIQLKFEQVLFDEEGKKFQEEVVKDSIMTYTGWYKNGNIKFIHTHSANNINMKNGLWIQYYENGFKAEEGNYLKDYRDGLWKYYDKDAKLIREELHRDKKLRETKSY